MILSDRTITSMLKDNNLCDLTKCELAENAIQPASIDITIGRSFSTPLQPKDFIIDFENPLQYTSVESDTYVLLPKNFVLATTMEYVVLPDNITAFVEGRSSIGRLGLFIQNAGWVDPGFKGQITLELFNASDYSIKIKAGTRVGQLVFARMDYYAANPYRGKYQGQTGATGSMIYKDFE